MYRVLLFIATAVTLAAAGAVTAATRSPASPALQLVDRSPLTVRGAHFKLRERVRVTASTGESTAIRVTRTTRLVGVFSVDFGTFAENPCATITIKAAGSKGDGARLVVAPPPGVDSLGPCGV